MIQNSLESGRHRYGVANHAARNCGLASSHLFASRTLPQWRIAAGSGCSTSDALRLFLTHHAEDTIVAVAHDSVNRAVLLQLLDQPLSAYWRLAQDPCCINEIDVVDGYARVVRINETHHLR
jgi:phosphoserine phosphatase